MKITSGSEMTVLSRIDFIKGACLLGMCGCFGTAHGADQTTGQTESEEIKRLRWRLDFVQERFVKLLEILDQALDEPTMTRVLQEMGRACARLNPQMVERFKGNLKGFLAYAQEQWVDKAELDEPNRTIRIVDKSDKCYCSFARQGSTPGLFCECSKGWMSENYSAIIGKPVEVTIEQSILRGGARCGFLIRYA